MLGAQGQKMRRLVDAVCKGLDIITEKSTVGKRALKMYQNLKEA